MLTRLALQLTLKMITVSVYCLSISSKNLSQISCSISALKTKKVNDEVWFTEVRISFETNLKSALTSNKIKPA